MYYKIESIILLWMICLNFSVHFTTLFRLSASKLISTTIIDLFDNNDKQQQITTINNTNGIKITWKLTTFNKLASVENEPIQKLISLLLSKCRQKRN